MSDKCQTCESNRLTYISGKCSDCFYNGITKREGYVPRDMNIGGGDYLEFDYCLNCGQIQGTFPLQKTRLELEKEGCNDQRNTTQNSYCLS